MLYRIHDLDLLLLEPSGVQQLVNLLDLELDEFVALKLSELVVEEDHHWRAAFPSVSDVEFVLVLVEELLELWVSVELFLKWADDVAVLRYSVLVEVEEKGERNTEYRYKHGCVLDYVLRA